MTPPVTVVTPSLPHRSHFLGEAKASVAAQTIQPITHLTEIDHDLEGPAPLLNRLIDQVTTPWFAVLPDDDLFDPDHLETLLQNATEADIVFSWCRFTGRDDGYTPYRGPFDPHHFLLRQESGLTGSFMARKSLWEKVGRYPEGVQLEDWNFLATAILEGARVVPVYRETWTYRFHPGSASSLIGRALRGDRDDEMDSMFIGRFFPRKNRAQRRQRRRSKGRR